MRSVFPVLLCLLALCSASPLAAQQFRWPLPGEANPAVVKSRPQESLFGMQNPGTLLLTANDSSQVVAPIRGTVRQIVYCYWYNFRRAATWPRPAALRGRTLEEQVVAIARANGFNPKAVTASITIDSADYSVTVSGVKLREDLSIGQRILRGHIIGTAGYFLEEVGEPNVALVTARTGGQADPLVLFGLAQPISADQKLGSQRQFSPPEIQQELGCIYRLLTRANPNTNVYRCPESVDSLYACLLRDARRSHDYDWLRAQCNALVQMPLDELTTIESRLPSDTVRRAFRYPVLFGVLNDSLVVTWAHSGIRRILGKRISRVDGIPADSVVQMIHALVRSPRYHFSRGGYTQGELARIELLQGGMLYNTMIRPADEPHRVAFELSDGSSVVYPPLPVEESYTDEVPETFASYVQQMKSQGIAMLELDTATAYIRLGNLSLSGQQLSLLLDFLVHTQRIGISNLIIDLRNARLGSLHCVAPLFAAIAQRSFRPYLYLESRCRSTCQLFNPERLQVDSLSRAIDFPDSIAPDVFRLTFNAPLAPDSARNYTGRVYVMVNERTRGIPSLFASLIRKHGRGVFIGRETGSAYYTMADEPLYSITLPYSKLKVTVPLVRVVFDTVPHPAQPWGRGVIPDFPFPLSIEELSGNTVDTMLQYTCSLVRRGEYPLEAPPPAGHWWHMLVSALVIAALVLGYWAYRLRKYR